MKQALTLIALVTAMPAVAEDSRQLDAHEHGVGALNIAIEDATVVMEFHAPGADIVGFEHVAEEDADLAAIEAAVATLSKPLDLFTVPDAAACTVTEARAELESEDDHDEHEDHDEHDEHAEDGHDEHEDHEHEDHAEHDGGTGHTEFHAEYTLNCDSPDALTQINFAYFEAFPNAKEVEVRIVTESGAQAFEVVRASPVLDLDG